MVDYIPNPDKPKKQTPKNKIQIVSQKGMPLADYCNLGFYAYKN